MFTNRYKEDALKWRAKEKEELKEWKKGHVRITFLITLSDGEKHYYEKKVYNEAYFDRFDKKLHKYPAKDHVAHNETAYNKKIINGGFSVEGTTYSPHAIKFVKIFNKVYVEGDK